jgi:competence protein ComEC
VTDDAPPTRFRWSAAPALPAAAAVLAGTRLGLAAVYAPPGPVVALALLGIALASRDAPRRRSPPLRLPGLLLAALALGFLNGHLRGAPPRHLPDPERPVTAWVETTGHWRRLGDVWSAAVTARGIEQGRRVWTRPVEAYLHVAAEGEPPPFGARLRVKGYLSRPAPLGNPPLRPPGPWRLQVKSWRLVAPVGEPGRAAALAGRLRRRVETGLAAAGRLRFGSDRSEGAEIGRDAPAPAPLGLPLVRALVLGDASEVPPRVVRGLRRSGLAHLLAVSGLHVGLAAAMALLAARALPRRGRLLAALLAVALYLLLVGPRPSLVRASVMACLVVAALLLERPPSAVNALGVAAAGIALLRPEAVTELGFQLSAGATAGLLLLAPLLSARWEGLPRALREPLAVSAGAQLGTLPWVLPAFCLLVPVAPLVNLVAVPWAGVLLAACGLWTGLAILAPGAAARALPLLDLLAAPAAWPAAVPASPWLALPLAPGPVGATLLAVGALGGLLRPRIGLAALAAAVLWAAALSDVAGPGPVEAVAIDVGQGDALLLRDGAGTLLIDGGGWPAGDLGGRVLLPALARRGVRRLDRVLLTHPDRDHCSGLVEVASYLAVGEVLTGPAATGPGAGGCAAELRALPGARHRRVTAGDRLAVGRWRLRVLHPLADGPGRPPAGDNDASVVVAAEVFGRRLLLTGDVEAAAERDLVARHGRGLRADVLKVAHHGSRSSSAGRFLAAATPSLALVSAGARNPYGHPAPEVLARLRAHGARVLRTDRDGMVVLRFHRDGRWAIDLPGSPK